MKAPPPFLYIVLIVLHRAKRTNSNGAQLDCDPNHGLLEAVRPDCSLIKANPLAFFLYHKSCLAHSHGYSVNIL